MEKKAVPNPAFQTTSICFRLSQIPLHNMTQYHYLVQMAAGLGTTFFSVLFFGVFSDL